MKNGHQREKTEIYVVRHMSDYSTGENILKASTMEIFDVTVHIYQPLLLQNHSLICTAIEGGGKGWCNQTWGGLYAFSFMILMLAVVSICSKAWISIVIDLPSPSWQQIVVFPVTQNRISDGDDVSETNWAENVPWHIFCEIYCLVVLFSFQLQRRRFKWENGSGFALGAALAATSGTPKTFQNLNVSSPAAVATVQPSGLCR